MPRIRWLIWTKHLDTNENRKQNHKTSKKKPKKIKQNSRTNNTKTHYGIPVKNYSDAV